jgi:Fur family transcriptional regulator, ferric uptake regulator
MTGQDSPEPDRLTPDPSGIADRCRAQGLRMTGQRRVIAEVLDQAADHPDVEELYRRISAVDSRIALSTVYRTVRLLVDAGILERHQFIDGRARYENADHEHHDHLIDMKTGKVIEFHSPEIEALQARIAEDLGYRITGHRLQLFCVPIESVRGRRGAGKRSS